MNRMIPAIVALAGLFVRVGWTGQADQTPFVPPTKCEPAAPMNRSAIGLPEAQGSARNAEIWALFFHSLEPLPLNRRVKIVWRMTGAGKFTVAAFSPAGRHLDPETGPIPHGSSTWAHHGDEWGTWFTFPTSGCWDLHASRDGSTGDVWVEVK